MYLCENSVCAISFGAIMRKMSMCIMRGYRLYVDEMALSGMSLCGMTLYEMSIRRIFV